MIGTGAVGLLLVAGWLSSRSLGGRLWDRAILSCFLGFSLWAAWALLVGRFVDAPSVAVLWGGLFACFWAGRMGASRPRSYCYHPATLGLFGLMALAAWLHLVGGVQLRPSREILAFDLPKISQWAVGSLKASHPLGTASDASVSPAAHLVSVWGEDPLRPLLWFGGLAQVGTLWLWFWLGAREHAKAPLATALGGLALFLGTSSGWMLIISPWLALAHLLVLTAIVSMVSRGFIWAAPSLLAVAFLSPGLALAGLLYQLGRSGPPRALMFLGLSAVSVAIYGGSWGALLAAFLYVRSTKREIRGLSLASLAYPGALEWAALGVAVGRTLTALWLKTPTHRWGWELGMVVPRRFPLTLLALVALWRSLIVGEKVYNDDILIRSQKEKASLSRLFTPHQLSEWVSWRGTVVGFESQDLMALSSLVDDGEVLYQTGQPEEQIEVPALLSTLAGGRAMAGWYASERGISPLPAAAAYFSTNDPELLRATPVRRVIRRGQSDIAVEPWPTGVGEGQAASLVPTRIEKWGQLLWFRADGATGYQVELDGVPFGQSYPVRLQAGREIPYVPPRLSGEIQLQWEHGLREAPPVWQLLAELKVAKELPVRSLLSVELELENPSSMRLELSDLTSLRWTQKRLLSVRPDEISPKVPLSPLMLEPNSTTTLKVEFRTPPEMGTYEVHLDFLDGLGEAHFVAFRSPLVIRTWRRHPLMAVPDGVVRVAP